MPKNSEIEKLTKDIGDIKNNVKNIEQQIISIDNNILKIFELINSITLFIEEAEDISDQYLEDEDEEDWTPYDERNFSYNNDEEDDGDGWGIREDES